VSAVLVSIIGPPAAGKTTLAHYLAAELPAGLIIEDYAGNPFLAGSYAGQRQAHLPAQLYFLLSRVAQLRDSSWAEHGTFVSDYGFCQDRIYADLRLPAEDLKLYDLLAGRMEATVHPPDLIIHLDASESTLLERIAVRGREFEKAITADFLAMVRGAYNSFTRSASCPVIAVDSQRADLRRADARRALVAETRRKMPAAPSGCRVGPPGLG
jgi:deoxyadenosine/deoxycytidine kinase